MMDKMLTDNILFIGFNQDCECFMCGLESGYRIYDTNFLKEKAREDGGGVKYVEMLYRCNYVGIVGGGKFPKYPKTKAIVWDDFQKKIAITLEFDMEVLAIKLRRDKIAVVFEKLIKVYSFAQTPQKLHVFETYSNPHGLCCLCSYSTNSNLAYLSQKLGQVIIVDLANPNKSPIEINAHEAAISCMTLSNEGNKLATSSVKGTLIRVFDAETGALLHELRRGANNANIFCLANATFLPKYFQSKWSSFKFDVNTNCKFICAFSQNNDPENNGKLQHSIIAICSDGTYFKYSLDNINDTKSCQLEDNQKFLELTPR